MSSYAAVATLPVHVEEVALVLAEQHTSAGWVRHTTTVVLRGAGCEGRGEDVTYASPEQQAFAEGPSPELRGRHASFDAYSRAIDAIEPALFPTPPDQAAARLYRRWALESAGLDLALRQAGTSLPERLARPPRPLRYVASTGLGATPSVAPLDARRDVLPDVAFKIDYAASWDDDLLAAIRDDPIACVDFKGHYHGTYEGPPADPARYAAVARALPDAVLEDPALSALDALAFAADRISWDDPVHGVADVLQLLATRWLNLTRLITGPQDRLLPPRDAGA